MLLLLSYIGETDASLQFDSRFSSISLTFLFDLSYSILQLNSNNPLILLNCRALNVNTASLRHRNAEGSPSR